MGKILVALIASCVFMYKAHASTTEPVSQSQFALSNTKISDYLRDKPLAYQIRILESLVDNPKYNGRPFVNRNIQRLKAKQERLRLSKALAPDEIADLAQRELAAKQEQVDNMHTNMVHLELTIDQETRDVCRFIRRTYSYQNQLQSYNDQPDIYITAGLNSATDLLNQHAALHKRFNEHEEFVAILTASIARNKTSIYNRQPIPGDLEAGLPDTQVTVANTSGWSNKLWALIPLNSSLS